MFSWIKHCVAEVCALPSARLVLYGFSKLKTYLSIKTVTHKYYINSVLSVINSVSSLFMPLQCFPVVLFHAHQNKINILSHFQPLATTGNNELGEKLKNAKVDDLQMASFIPIYRQLHALLQAWANPTL